MGQSRSTRVCWLLHWRESRGINGANIAKKAGWSGAKQSRLENATQPIQPSQVITLALLYGIPEAERDAVFNSCLSAQQEGWWDEVRKEALVADLLDYVEFESEATAVRTFKIDLVPGLMQTPGYAAAVEAAFLPRASDEVVAERVEARIKRQERLLGENPIHIEAVLAEGALRTQVGGPEGSLESEQITQSHNGDRARSALTKESTVSLPDLTHAVWRKSSRSAGGGNECVEVAFVSGAAALRDSKNPGGGVLILSPGVWRAFRSVAGGSR